MFRKSRVAKNAGWIIATRIVQSVLALFINMLTARYLGPSNYGLINYAASIIAFVVPIMNLGLTSVLVQEFTNHPEEEGKIIGTSILMSICSSFACFFGVIIYTFLVDVGEPVTHIVVILYSLMLFAQALEMIRYWFQAKLISKYTAVISLIAYVIVSTYKIVLLVFKLNISLFAISHALDYFLIAVSLFVVYKKLGGQRISFSSEIGKRMFKKSKYYILSGLMVVVYGQTDKVMIKLMINEEAVGYYSAAVSCAGMTSFVFAAIIDSFRPLVFEHKKNNNNLEYEKSITRLYSVIIYIALAQSVFMTVFAQIIISILYGKAYYASISALQIIVWYTTFSYYGGAKDVWILGEGKQKYLVLLDGSGAVINIVLNYFFINMWGINGAAIASLITQILTNIGMMWIIKPLRDNQKLLLRSLNPKILISMLKR